MGAANRFAGGPMRDLMKTCDTVAARRTPSGSSLLLCLWVALLTTTGCVSKTVSMESQPEVSEARAKRDLGVDYLSTGRTAMAIRQLGISLELDPGDAQTHLWLGEAYRRKGQTEVALEFLEDAIPLAVRDEDKRTEHEAQLNLSALLSQLGRYEESLEYSDALSADPTLSTPWRPLSNSGWALMKLGRLDEARAKLDESLEYFPNYGPALLNLGILEAKEGHRLAAIKTLERALERLNSSGRAEVNYRLGELYVALGQRNRAVEHFQEAVKTAPNLDWGSQSQAYLDLLR
jgi:Tfp pilus assembly protein PilF